MDLRRILDPKRVDYRDVFHWKPVVLVVVVHEHGVGSVKEMEHVEVLVELQKRLVLLGSGLEALRFLILVVLGLILLKLRVGLVKKIFAREHRQLEVRDSFYNMD